LWGEVIRINEAKDCPKGKKLRKQINGKFDYIGSKVKLSLCLRIKHYAMNVYGGVDV
jgi:hypothetical protein